MIDAKGNLKLADFGLSKLTKEPTFSFCGSPEYLSPEMLTHKGHNSKSDIYQIGVLMYEMLVGLPPFYDDMNTEKMFDSIVSDKISLPYWLSRNARSLLLQLLDKNPSKRPDACEIKQHLWLRDFKPIDPPIIP